MKSSYSFSWLLEHADAHAAITKFIFLKSVVSKISLFNPPPNKRIVA